MKLKLYQLVNPTTIKALEVLSTEILVPRSKVWDLAKTISRTKTELDDYNKARIAAFKKYGVQKGDDLEVPASNVAAFNAELEVILNTEIELPLKEAIEIPSKLPDDSKLTAGDILALEYNGFIKEKI